MPIDLYYAVEGAPCRHILLVAAALDIKLNLKPMDLDLERDQMKPEFLELNPQHTVPTIVDDGFVLWESRAISRYLVNKYGGEALYPEDPRQRAIVDQRLDFDLGTLYPRFAEYFYPIAFEGAQRDETAFHQLEEALGFLNTFLESRKYSAGDQLTLADLALVTSVSTIELSDVDLEKYPNIVRWYELVKSTAPGYQESNEKALEEMKLFIIRIRAMQDSEFGFEC